MISKNIKVALVVLIGLLIVGLPFSLTAQSVSSKPQPMVYRYTGWWDGLHYNVLSGNRPDMKLVRPILDQNPGLWITPVGAAESSELLMNTDYDVPTGIGVNNRKLNFSPRPLESALAVAVYVDTTLGYYNAAAGVGTLTHSLADTARAYVALVADGVAKDIKVFEPNLYRLIFDSADNAQTPFIDSLTRTTGNLGTVQIVLGSAGFTHAAYGGTAVPAGTHDMWDIVENSEIVKVNNTVWSKVSGNLSALPSSAKCYTVNYNTGLVTLRNLVSGDNVVVECVVTPDLITTTLDPGIRYGSSIFDNYLADTNTNVVNTTNYPNIGVPIDNAHDNYFSSWGRICDMDILPYSQTVGADQIHQYINLYVLDQNVPNDSSYLFCYSKARYDRGFTSLSLPYSQRYRGSFVLPTALSVVSATASNPGVNTVVGAIATAQPSAQPADYTVNDSIRIFVTDAGANRIVIINGSIGFDGRINTIVSNWPTGHPDRDGETPYSSATAAAGNEPYLRLRTAWGGSRLNFLPDTFRTTLNGNTINQVIYFNRNEESFSTKEWPTVWVDEDADGSYEVQEVWQRVNNLTVVGDTGAYQLDRFADPDGVFAPGDAFTKYGGGKLMFGNGVHGRKPAAGSTWQIKIAYYPSPDMFVFDNTYADSTAGASGQISQPSGIASRYNELTGKVDVYVGDRGHAVVKKYTWDENAQWAYKFKYVSKFGEGLDPVSIAVGKYHKNSTTTSVADSSDVYVYVADYSNDKVHVFRDDQALNPASTAAPTQFLILGGTGTELGQFTRPTDVYVVSGERFNNRHGESASGTGDVPGTKSASGFYGNKLDLYVADWGGSSSGGRVTRLEGVTNRLPTIVVSFSGSGRCGDSKNIFRHPLSTFPISYAVTDDNLSSCSIDLYWAPTDTSSLANCIQIVSGLAAPTSGNGAYNWTPNTMVQAGLIIIPDTGVVLGVITDYYAQAGYDYSDQGLILDSSTPTLKFLSDFNCQGTVGDSIIVVHEGEGYGWAGEDPASIILYIENPDQIVFFNVAATFDTSVIKIIDITVGEALTNIGGDAYEFYYTPSVDEINATASFAITGAIKFPATNEGISCPGALARIRYKVDTTGINTTDKTAANSTRFIQSDPGTVGKGITMDLVKTFMIRNGKNGNTIYDTLVVKDFKNASLYKTLLGDIAGPNYYNTYYRNFPAPNMIPAPDGRIDNEDVMAFVFAWNGVVDHNIGYQDPLADIFPSFSWKDGVRAPYLFARPDCFWEPDDVITFSEMYSWFKGFNPSNTVLAKAAITAELYDEKMADLVQLKYVTGKLTEGSEAIFDLVTKDVKDLKFVRAIFNFNPDELEIVTIEEKGFLGGDGTSTMLFKDLQSGKLDLAAVRMGNKKAGISGSGQIVRLTLRARKSISSELIYTYQIFNSQTALSSEKTVMFDTALLNKLGVPKTYQLSQNFPNPFNPTTEIQFALPENTKVSLTIYNIAGELVKTMVDENLGAGNYTYRWNGTNDRDKKVSAGLYFYQITTPKYNETRKMILLK